MFGSVLPRVKICCISSTLEAEWAIEQGASAIGLVSNMPSGPGVINNEQIASIAKTIPSTISTFLLTSETKADKIIAQTKLFDIDTIQLVDEVSDEDLKDLKDLLNDITLIQVIHVLNKYSIDLAISKSKIVDAILLDSGAPKQTIKRLGGTGQTHNWNISRTIREEIDKPLWLAGGINQFNVREAIELVQPFGIDLCSGVRTNGQLDQQKLIEFFKALKQ